MGIGVITLPFDVFTKANGSAWIAVLLAGICVQLVILLFGVLIKRFPTTHLFGIMRLLFGKFIGNILIILYSLFYIAAASIVLAKYVYLIKAWMIPLTPKWVLLILMGFTIILIVKENLQIIAHFVFLSSLFFTGFFIMGIYALKDANLTFILPIASSGITPIIEGIPPSFFAFQGFEILLLIHPFVQATNKAIIKTASYANLFVTLFYAFSVLVTLLFFSPRELKLLPEPVLYLIKSFSFRIIERPDLLFTSMWMIFVTTTLIGVIYAASLGLLTLTHSMKLRNYTLVVTIICLIIASLFHGIYDITFVSKYYNYIVIPILCGLPIVFLLVSIIFNKKEEVKNE